MPQIEHIAGVRNIDSILKVKGIDSIFIGPYDLSASMGLTGQVNHSDVISAIDHIKNKCKGAGLPYGIFGINPEALEQEIKDGCRFPVCGVDLSILSDAYRIIFGRLDVLRGFT
jgi:2-keto-3-deoxy-L-rhamnonate aldolase RhmA